MKKIFGNKDSIYSFFANIFLLICVLMVGFYFVLIPFINIAFIKDIIIFFFSFGIIGLLLAIPAIIVTNYKIKKISLLIISIYPLILLRLCLETANVAMLYFGIIVVLIISLLLGLEMILLSYKKEKLPIPFGIIYLLVAIYLYGIDINHFGYIIQKISFIIYFTFFTIILFNRVVIEFMKTKKTN